MRSSWTQYALSMTSYLRSKVESALSASENPPSDDDLTLTTTIVICCIVGFYVIAVTALFRSGWMSNG